MNPSAMFGESGQEGGPGPISLDPMTGPGRPRPTGRFVQEDATVLAAENSDVSPVNSFVAVAVIALPTATLLDGEKVEVAWPDPSTVRLVFWPMKVLPSRRPKCLRRAARCRLPRSGCPACLDGRARDGLRRA
jgi:hypothetical protein